MIVPVRPALAFRAFSDLRRLLNRGIYEQAVWTEGVPWKVGSRVRYDVLQPVRATISAVVTSADPPRSVSLLNHALGITAEQQVSFDPVPGGTKVRMAMEFVGESPDLPAHGVHKAIAFYTKDAVDTMADLCRQWDEIASAAGSSE